MRWPLRLLVLTGGIVAGTVPARAQLSGGTSDLPITAPSLSALETPGLSTDHLKSLDGVGAIKPADEILKSLDKDLGRHSLLDPGEYSRDRPMEGPRNRPGEDLGKDPAGLSTFR
jgi:hypothetical protein